MWFDADGSTNVEATNRPSSVVSPALAAKLSALHLAELYDLRRRASKLLESIFESWDFDDSWSIKVAQELGQSEADYEGRAINGEAVLVDAGVMSGEELWASIEGQILASEPRWQADLALAIGDLMRQVYKSRSITKRLIFKVHRRLAR